MGASWAIAQRISASLHRENARAVLERAPIVVGESVSGLGLQVLAESSVCCAMVAWLGWGTSSAVILD